MGGPQYPDTSPSDGPSPSGGNPYDINGTSFNPDLFIKKIIKVLICILLYLVSLN